MGKDRWWDLKMRVVKMNLLEYHPYNFSNEIVCSRWHKGPEYTFTGHLNR
jgi:hypothetical protein